jgi:hypothetical protein
LYSSPNIKVTKSRRTGWEENVAHIGGKRNAYKTVVGKPEGKNHFEDLSVDGKKY